MSSSVICEKTCENNKFGILVNSKFLGDLKEERDCGETLKETVFRHNGTSVEKIIEYDQNTGVKVRITNYDYFDDKKVKSVEEFDLETGVRKKVTSYTLFKSVTEFDIKTGKKVKTTNYDIKNESKKTSVYDFDIELEKISRVTIYRSDGNAVSMVKEIDPSTGLVVRSVSYKKGSTAISSVSKYEFQGDKTVKTTFYYNTPIYFTSPAVFDKKVVADTLNKKVLDESSKRRVERLIDSLYRNKMNFSSISV